ncbi:MAG: hypothetical protein HYV34_01790 [Candidatus Kerfeldbacteria bacterium]|nr:hypothetical protein [Candidatus Kerfeldbacteria bacterium]
MVTRYSLVILCFQWYDIYSLFENPYIYMRIANWQHFGLRENPYDTSPLKEGASLPIQKAFVGREKEQTFLDHLFLSGNRVCLAVCGDVGVGKTSMVNFHKFQWKYHKEQLLFSSRKEIEAHRNLLTKEAFLLEIIGSLLREIELLDSTLVKDELLAKLGTFLDITYKKDLSFEANIMGSGIGMSRDTVIDKPDHLPMAKLEGYFQDLLEFIRRNEIGGYRYSGIIVHVNNFDVVLREEDQRHRVVQFFGEIRDLLQTPNAFFLFLGPSGFFRQIIAPEQRVKSIFHPAPMMLEPLSKKEIVHTLDERMNILKSETAQKYIKPVSDEVVFRLYDIYQGDIRSIMSALNDIVSQYSEQVRSPLVLDEAMVLLGDALWERISQTVSLTREQKQLLLHIAASPSPLTQKQVAEDLHKEPANISGYYFRRLKDAGVIELKEQKGKLKYWGLTSQYLPLHEYSASLIRLKEGQSELDHQLSMF